MSFGSPSSSYERSAFHGASFDDLSHERLESFVREQAPHLLSEGLEQAAVSLGILTTSGSRTLPTVAGMVLFGRAPQRMQPQWGVVGAKLAGRRLSDEVVVREDLEGDLLTLYRAGLDFVDRHCEELINQVRPDQDRTWEFAPRAVEEALLNALLHRDLRTSGRVALRIFDDRLEIWSPGGTSGTPGSLSDLLALPGTSLPRNPLVAAFARQMGLGEQLGRGLPVIQRAIQEQSSGDLTLQESKQGILLAIPSSRSAPHLVGELTN